MTETIEEEALRRLNEVSARTEKLLSPWQAGPHAFMDAFHALITEHRATKAELEAFRREVSEAILRGIDLRDDARLARFIIPQPDPLVEALEEWSHKRDTEGTASFRAILAARNLKIVEATDEQ